MLEARLGETIPDALLANLETVGDVVRLIETFQSEVERQTGIGVTNPPYESGLQTPLTNREAELRQVPRWYARAFRAVLTGIYRNYFSLKCYGT